MNHKGTYSRKPEIPSEHPAMVILEIESLYTVVPISSIGGYASQPCGTCSPTPIMLMKIVIQQQKHEK